jgi:hypothetical protein
MRYFTLLAVLAWLTMALVGCSRSSSTAAPLKNFDLGVIDISGGKPSDHVLSDGRVCTVTPELLTNGNVRLTTVITETNTAGIRRTTHLFEAPVGQRVTFAQDTETSLTLKLQTSK